MGKISRRGQGVVEMALMVPIFMVVVLLIVDFSRALHVYSALNHQCAEAARIACKRINQFVGRNLYTSDSHTPLATVLATFNQYRSPLAQSAAPTITGVGNSSTVVTVKTSFDLPMFTPFLASFIESPGLPGTYRLAAMAQSNKE